MNKAQLDYINQLILQTTDKKRLQFLNVLWWKAFFKYMEDKDVKASKENRSPEVAKQST